MYVANNNDYPLDGKRKKKQNPLTHTIHIIRRNEIDRVRNGEIGARGP